MGGVFLFQNLYPGRPLALQVQSHRPAATIPHHQHHNQPLQQLPPSLPLRTPTIIETTSVPAPDQSSASVPQPVGLAELGAQLDAIQQSFNAMQTVQITGNNSSNGSMFQPGPGLQADTLTLNTLNSTLATSSTTTATDIAMGRGSSAAGWTGGGWAKQGPPPVLAMDKSGDVASSATEVLAGTDADDDSHRIEQLLWLSQQEVRTLKDKQFEHEDEIAQAKKTVLSLAQRSETAVAENEHLVYVYSVFFFSSSSPP